MNVFSFQRACPAVVGGFLLMTGAQAADLEPLPSAPAPVQTDVFISGEAGYHTYRIPSVLTTSQGTVLAFCEGRKGGRGDAGNIDLLLKRSFDAGQTWSTAQVIWDDGSNTCGNPCVVQDRTTGTIHLLMTHNLGSDHESAIWDGTSEGTRTVWVSRSDDEGQSWSTPNEITDSVKPPNWSWYATGPGMGIQLERGARRGRLLIPCDHGVLGGRDYHAHMIYSDDHGETWHVGGSTPDKTCSESQVAELADGGLLLDIRTHFARAFRRKFALSDDGGQTWSESVFQDELIDPHCQASLIGYRDRSSDKVTLLFSNPAATDARRNLTVRVSRDDGRHWEEEVVLHPGPAAYSCLTVLADGQRGCLYERGERQPYERITFARWPSDRRTAATHASTIKRDEEAPFTRNVIFILSDDHRYDFMSFHPQAPAFLETPHLDRMAREGAHGLNAFVTTSLCSPSRASILTGQMMRRHQVVDNQRPVPPGTTFFPQYLRAAGITTAFVGKWHMGHDTDAPQPGFDYWASFRGQGDYFDQELNINGRHRRFEGYNSDILTEVALEWLGGQGRNSPPFFLYLSYKAPHYPFTPAPRHRGRYHGQPIDYPETMARTERNYRTQPRWVKERRYSIHGIDHMETGPFDQDPVPDFDELYWSYCEAVHSLDENVGRVLGGLEALGLATNSLVIYMGDNGFHLGEHGFYDKRDAFETSIRVPLLAWAPGRIDAGRHIKSMLLNLDLAPTILAALGVTAPPAAQFQGHSFLPLLRGQTIPWRDHFVYEYHWEWNFPATPSQFAIRTDRYKYVYYHGLWDINSLHDLVTDPLERHNLIEVPAYRDQTTKLRQQLFDELATCERLVLPVRRPAGERLGQRKLPW